jgi:KUP system potassium uptake protein
VIHTSKEEIGQIYVPEVNALLMVSTIVLIIGFRSSSRLAAAYGVAVTSTMVITSLLFYAVARWRWGWGRAAAGGLTLLFLVVDVMFFAANIGKILHGAWFPLVVGGVIFIVMITWRKGRRLLAQKMTSESVTLKEFLVDLMASDPPRVERKAVFLTGQADTVPPALLHNLKHNRVLHAEIAFLTVVTEEIPRVPRADKVEVGSLGNGFHRVIAHYGFMEDPNVPHVLALAREKGLDFPLDEVSFFLGREKLLSDRRPRMPRWQRRLFGFLSHNALGATTFFHIPAGQVVEIGSQVEL